MQPVKQGTRTCTHFSHCFSTSSLAAFPAAEQPFPLDAFHLSFSRGLSIGPVSSVLWPKPAPLASIASSLTYSLGEILWDHRIRSTFNTIDNGNKGHITEADLVNFAQVNGLPTAYVKKFTAAALHSNAAAPTAPIPEGTLNFEAFSTFVKSRETALKHAFDLFDWDKDGKINAEDLDKTLSHVAVCCPRTRSVYRCRQQCVRELLQAANAYGNQYIDLQTFREFFLLLPQTEMMVEYWVSAREASTSCDYGTKFGLRGEGSGPADGSPWGHLFAGAVAGAASRTATAPLETIRLAAMAGQLQQTNIYSAATHVVHTQGWKGLYRGNFVNVVRSAPQKALDFYMFDCFKKLLGTDSSGPVKTFLAAGLAGATSWLLLYPLEVVRSRMTVDTLGRYTGLTQSLHLIIRSEGHRSLYRGLGPSLAAIFPEAAITYGLHDLLKRAYRNVHEGEDPSVLVGLGFGVLSAFTGQLVSYPLETISRRMQLQAGHAAPASVLCTVSHLLKEGGPPALYRGVGAASLRLVPMAIVSFGTYELVRSLLIQMETETRDVAVRWECEKRQQGQHHSQEGHKDGLDACVIALGASATSSA